jgi:hypothetical protein
MGDMGNPNAGEQMDGTCHICHEDTCSVAANPSKWAIWLPYWGGNGKRRSYCHGCVIRSTSLGTPEPIRVWAFKEAPKQFKDLSTNGGDEDWVALVPPGYGYVGWLEDGTQFGCCDVSSYDQPDGYKVYIGSHA